MEQELCLTLDIFQQTFRLILKRPWQTRTHCCRHKCFPVCPRAQHCGHKFCVRDTKNVSGFGQKQFVSATNVSQFAQPKKHQGKQCVLVYQGLKTLFTLCCRNLKTAFFTHFFRPHYSGEIWKNATIIGHFGSVFEEDGGREITWFSLRHRFRIAPFSANVFCSH